MIRALSNGDRGKTRIAIALVTLLIGGFTTTAQSSQSGPNGSTQAQIPSLPAVFDNKVDSKTAKVGDPVVAKTTRELKLSDLDIPRGSKLEGTITSVKPAEGGNDDSMLGVRFDRIEIKKEKLLRIQGLIVAIGPAPKNETGIGYDSVMSRGGVEPTVSLDPSIAADKYDKDKAQLKSGSSLEGVALSTNFDPDGATLMRGVHRNVKLSPDVMIRVAIFQPK